MYKGGIIQVSRGTQTPPPAPTPTYITHTQTTGDSHGAFKKVMVGEDGRWGDNIN